MVKLNNKNKVKSFEPDGIFDDWSCATTWILDKYSNNPEEKSRKMEALRFYYTLINNKQPSGEFVRAHCINEMEKFGGNLSETEYQKKNLLYNL